MIKINVRMKSTWLSYLEGLQSKINDTCTKENTATIQLNLPGMY